MESLEDRDPAAAIRAIEVGIEDRRGHIQYHQREIDRHRADIEHMRETLGMVRARHPEL